MANTGRSDLNCSGYLVSEEFGLEPRGAENTSFIFSQLIKMQKSTDMNFILLEMVLVSLRMRHFCLDVFPSLLR